MKPINLMTPVGKQEVTIKEWITGREAEYIDELMYEAVAVRADVAGTADIGSIDLKKMVTETNHRKITTFVISVAGKSQNILDSVLDMHEDDTAFILERIDNQRKKK